MNHIAILTSGGDSPGMNPAIRAATRSARNFGFKVTGIMNGYEGLLNREFMKLDNLKVSGINRLGGTILQSSRCKEFRTAEGVKKGADILREEGIEGLIVIGGDGSLHGALDLHELEKFPVIGIPGTIDNDIYGTEMGIGVDTALNTIISLVDMIKATASSHRRCFIVEVMGRGSGYLALLSAIATGAQASVIPEHPVNIDSIIEVMKRRFEKRHNNSVLMVSEGVCSGQEFMERLNKHSGGVFPYETRLTVLGHVQRGGTPTHFDRLLGARMAEMAVISLVGGKRGMMVAQANGKITLLDMETVLGKKSTLPKDSMRLARHLGIEIGDAEGV